MKIKDGWDQNTDTLDFSKIQKTIVKRHNQEHQEKIVCLNCGKIHKTDAETFLTFYGNVTIGLSGGIIGNNFSNKGELSRVTFLCRKEVCCQQMFHYVRESTNEKD